VAALFVIGGSQAAVWSDTTPPETSITTKPSNPTRSTSASLGFSSSEAGSTFQCKLDTSGFSACTSPKSYSGLTAGSHSFSVRAIDAAGNVDATPASYTWRIDVTAPNTTITSAPPSSTNSTSAGFSFASSEVGSSFQCKLDAANYASCASPKAYSGLAAGSHTFSVRARDAAGNWDGTPASYRWTIDLTAPDTTITAAPASTTTSMSATFTFTSLESGSTFECKLDAGLYTACATSKSYGALAAGAHTFSVRAIDAVGNVDASPANHSWAVTTSTNPSDPPETWITSGPAVWTTSTSASFTFVATETAGFLCSLDYAAYARCTSPMSYSSLAAGRHVFSVYAADTGGMGDKSPAVYWWMSGTNRLGVTAAGRVRPWAAQFMNETSSPTEAEAIADAKNFDLLSAHPSAYGAYVDKMKQASPLLELAVYQNATFTFRTDLPEFAYSHDADGNRISPHEWPNTYLLNPSSELARRFKMSEATEKLARSGYDGLALDVTGLGPLKTTYVNALPINPATGKVYTADEWLVQVDGLVDEVISIVNPRPVYLNSLKNGPSYFDPVTPLRDSLRPGITGSWAETWLRETAASITAYPSETVWKQNVDMLPDAGARGYSVLQITKLYVTATTAQKDAWYKYTLASWLLGNDGRAFFSVTYEKGDLTVVRPLNRFNLGAASGPYAKVSGVYQRSFTGGRVLVNPTSSTVTVSLGGTYRTLAGASVTSVTLGPKTAEILKL
jgi:hypothetical protein